MRPPTPTFWLLNGSIGWRTAWPCEPDDCAQATEDCPQPKPTFPTPAVEGGAGIRLAGDPNGPLALTSDDGSLGGLVLPRGMALDPSYLLYLLDFATLEIKRFEPVTASFEPLPSVGGRGSDARHFAADTQSIAVAGNDLYVADTGNSRVQVFALSSLALRYVWTDPHCLTHSKPAAADATNDDGSGPFPWEPVDVAAAPDLALILDRRNGAVYAHRPGVDRLECVICEPEAANRWTRVAVDSEHRIYLLDPLLTHLQVYDLQGRKVDCVADAGEVLDRFPAPAVRLDHHGRFCLATELSLDCARSQPDPPPSREDPLAACRCAPASVCSGLLFDRHGARLEPVTDPEPLGPMPYRREGTWISAGLDSAIYNCQWHRLEMSLMRLPTGGQLTISTYADNELRTLEEILTLPEHLWESRTTIVGSTQPSGQSGARQTDTLVRSDAGQYLWIRLALASDGYDTPVVDKLIAHYPRDSYLQYLPEIYGADDEARGFGERFLSLFQTEWDAIEGGIYEFARYLDPEAVPDSPWVDWLAQWLAQPLEGSWDGDQKRRLLAAIPEVYEARGTPQSLRRYLQAYLENMTGLTVAQQRGLPVIIEAFRQRNYLMLTSPPAKAVVNGFRPLWSPGVVGRLQVDVYATTGDVRLISSGDPERDMFHAHAHRFQVFVPSAWIQSGEDERMLRRALDAEKPAHAAYKLCLVEPRMRVGVQSTVGVDTILGAIPAATLPCPEDDIPPSRPPRQRLGYDTVLAGHPEPAGGVALNPGARVGLDTVLS